MTKRTINNRRGAYRSPDDTIRTARIDLFGLIRYTTSSFCFDWGRAAPAMVAAYHRTAWSTGLDNVQLYVNRGRTSKEEICEGDTKARVISDFIYLLFLGSPNKNLDKSRILISFISVLYCMHTIFVCRYNMIDLYTHLIYKYL